MNIRSERSNWSPVHLLGIGLSVYVISLAMYRGMGRESALSVTATHGAAHVVAIGYMVAGVSIGLVSMAYVVIRDSLRPMVHIAAFLLAFATMALFRVEQNIAANIFNCARYLAVASVAAGAWLYQMRETCDAYQ